VLQMEDGRLPWLPPVSDLRDRVAAAMRSVLKVRSAFLGRASALTSRAKRQRCLVTSPSPVGREPARTCRQVNIPFSVTYCSCTSSTPSSHLQVRRLTPRTALQVSCT
jgi:hypothetical protein